MSGPDTREFRRLVMSLRPFMDVENKRKGGRARTPAKIAASRRNGKLGGHRKVKP